MWKPTPVPSNSERRGITLRSSAVTIYVDSTACMSIASKSAIDRKTKHIEMYYHFLRERVIEFKDIILKYVKSEDNIADVFTKPLAEELFVKHVNNMYAHPL